MLSTTWTVRGVGGTVAAWSAAAARIRMRCTESLYTAAHDSSEPTRRARRHHRWPVLVYRFRAESTHLQSRSVVAAGDAEPLDHGCGHRRLRRREAAHLGDAPARDADGRRALRGTVERGGPR